MQIRKLIKALKILSFIFLSVLIFSGLIYVYYNDPSTSGIYPKCVFHEITGFYCPGCGSLRAAHQLLHFNIVAAIRYNSLLVVILIPLLFYAVINELRNSIFKKNNTNFTQSAAFGFIMIGVVIAFWILRNIPVYPLVLLAPHK